MALAPKPELFEDVIHSNDSKIIYVTEGQVTEWTKDATKLLIELYEEKMDLFIKGVVKTKKTVYELISSEMTNHNFYYAPGQCENKWKSLKRAYLSRYEKDPDLINFRPRLFEKEVAKIVQKEKSVAVTRKVRENSNTTSDRKSLRVEIIKPADFEHLDDQSEDQNNSDDEMQNILLGNVDPETYDEILTSDIDEHQYASYTNKRKRSSLSESFQIQTVTGGDGRDDVTKELSEVKNVLKRHCTETARVQRDIVKYLDGLEKIADEDAKLKQVQIEKQTEMIQQMKIQNSLIAKLIQKLG